MGRSEVLSELDAFVVATAILVTVAVVLASFRVPASERRRDPAFKQRFRQPRTPNPDLPPEQEEARQRVPAIGNGYRWYDYAYNGLRWFLRDSGRRFMPLRARARILIYLNKLMPFSEHDHHWAQWHSARRELQVPEFETVTTAGIWVLELFTPSALRNLEKTIQREGWKRRRWYDSESENAHQLEESRSGAGSTWWWLADLVEPRSREFVPDATRMQLPREFQQIELRAIQVGEGLTAVVAHFHLHEDSAAALDREWHRKHPPILVKASPRWHAHEGEWAAFWQTQTQRQSLHDEARKWLASHVPGYFADRRRPLPLMDLLLFDQIDPIDFYDSDGGYEDINPDIFRALGLSVSDIRQRVSADLPGLLLSPLEPRLHSGMGDVPTWTLWGKRSRVIEEMGNALDHFGGTRDEAIAFYLVERAYNLFVMFGVNEFSDITARELASLRDRATTQHGRFKASAIRSLRKEFLRVSIDLATIRRDVVAFWKRKYPTELDADFVMVLSPRLKRIDAKFGRAPEEDIDFNDFIRKRQLRRLRQLSVSDAEYRDILSTVASLGASADSFTLSRFALLASIASLVVALGAILLSSWSDENVLTFLVDKLIGAVPSDGKG